MRGTSDIFNLNIENMSKVARSLDTFLTEQLECVHYERDFGVKSVEVLSKLAMRFMVA